MAESVPPEILEKVFEHLDPASRKSVRLVNRKWADVLWTDRFLRSQVLLVNPATLTDDSALQKMKRPFREIHIATDVIPADNWKTIYYDRVKDLITSAVVFENVRVIKLDANLKILNYLFHHQHALSYDNLEEFTFLTSADNPCPGRVNINASFPNLQVLKLDYLSSGNLRLIRLFSRQLTTLVVRVAYRRRLLAILAIRTLDKLTALAIGTVPHSRSDLEILEHDDFDPHHLAVLRRIQHLEINDAANMFEFAYHFILSEMPNLRHLKITGIEMGPNALEAVNQLENLQFLQLLAHSRNTPYMPMVRLNLPNLETLHLAPQLMACAGQLPRLRTLAVINGTKRSGGWHHYAGPAALHTFTALRSLEKVHIRGIFFSGRNLHPVVHFHNSCKVLLEDKEEFLIGTINVARSVDVTSLRCNYRDEIDDLMVRRPTVSHGEVVDQDVSQYVAAHSRSCTSWIELRVMRRLEKLGDRIVHDYKSFKRSIQRSNLYTLQKYGCTCNCYYRPRYFDRFDDWDV
ncbi:hypothetical protein RP20_CCG019886 [Aedes albopictus]|nr:hypothetical protein RP20_CCG019886 [Aedes albopictus]